MAEAPNLVIRQLDGREDGPNNIEVRHYSYPGHEEVKLHVNRGIEDIIDPEYDFAVPIEPEEIQDAMEHPYRYLSSFAEQIGSFALNELLNDASVGGRKQ